MFLEQLLKLDSDIYIHVDLKAQNMRNNIRHSNNIHVLSAENSYDISWGSVNMVCATLALINAAKESDIYYDYLWLVSGQDFPIVSAETISNRLESNNGINYIEIIPRGERYDWYKKLYEVAYPNWINRNSVPVKIYKRFYKIITGGNRYTFPAFRRKKPFDFDFEFGSQWWTLTSEAAYWCLDYCNGHPEYLEYFKKCIIPDECFFQTLYTASPYKNARRTNLTYINWGSNRRSPETLTLNDIDKLLEKRPKYCIARKFDLNNREVIKVIRDAINGQ